MEKTQSYGDIVRKVRGLLAKSEESFDDEGQNAFLLAQRLMIKYNLDQKDINQDAQPTIIKSPITEYKKLLWWERELATIIAENFRVKMYYETQVRNSYSYRRILFYGLSDDTDLANEMYILAYEALRINTEKFIDYSRHHRHPGRPVSGVKLKNSYREGFITGLKQKFFQQIHELKGKYEVLVMTPDEVDRAFARMTAGWETLDSFKRHPIHEETFRSGYHTAQEIDLTRSTIGRQSDNKQLN